MSGTIKTPTVYFNQCLEKGIETLIESEKDRVDIGFSCMVLTVSVYFEFRKASFGDITDEKAISLAFLGDYTRKYFSLSSIEIATISSQKYLSELNSGQHITNYGLDF